MTQDQPPYPPFLASEMGEGDEVIRRSSTPANSEPKPATGLAIRTVRCPRCFATVELNCDGLDTLITCEQCGVEYEYLDGYYTFYREYPELFVDPVHSMPLSPGHSVNGRVLSAPDDLLIVDFGMTYRRPPDVFFLVSGNRTAHQWISQNQVLLPLSVSEENFILFSRSIDRGIRTDPTMVHWMAIGETGNWSKPLWLNYLQNAADLVRQEEDVASVVMLLMALDFYYDAILHRHGITFSDIRRRGRGRGMNEKRAKLAYIQELFGDWPARFEATLGELTDYRNHIVHGIVKADEPSVYNGRQAFKVVMRAIMFLIEMQYRVSEDRGDNMARQDG